MEGDVSNNGECSPETGTSGDGNGGKPESIAAELKKLVVLNLDLIHQQSEVINSKEKIILQLQKEKELFRQRALRLERKLVAALEQSRKQAQETVQTGDFYGFASTTGGAEADSGAICWPVTIKHDEIGDTGHSASFSDVFHDFATSHVVSDIEVESHVPSIDGGAILQEVVQGVEEVIEVTKVDASTDTADLVGVAPVQSDLCQKCGVTPTVVKTECCFLARGRRCVHSSVKCEPASDDRQWYPEKVKNCVKTEKKIRFKEEVKSICDELDDDKVLTPGRSERKRNNQYTVRAAKLEVGEKKLEGKQESALLSTPTPTVRWKRTATTKVTWEAESVTKKLFQDETVGAVKDLDRSPESKKLVDSQLVPDTSDILLVDEPYHVACTYSLQPSAVRDRLSANVEIPSFCVRVFTPVYTMEGTEPLGDDVYMKRHAKFDADEKKRKRWDHQRIREQRQYLRLRSRYESDDDDSGGGRHLTLKTFVPDPDDVESIAVYPKLPVNVFGMPLPKLAKREFRLSLRSKSTEDDMELKPKRRKMS